MLSKKIKDLKEEIIEVYSGLNNIFDKFEITYESYLSTKEYSKLVESAFYVNQLYSGFEYIFKCVAKTHIEKGFFHKPLLDRMRMDIENIRPALISEESYKYLIDLRAFRNFFRNVYNEDINPKKFKIIADKTAKVRTPFDKDFTEFLTFLDLIIDKVKTEK